MFNSVVLDVVIGLVFIYLLYSLFVTIISELISSLLSLRARNLKEAIDRMLNDEEPGNWWKRLWDTLKLTKSPNNEVVNAFYNNQEIKYLGSSGVFKHPSSFKAGSFAKTIINLLANKEPVTPEAMKAKLDAGDITITGKSKDGADVVTKLDTETAEFIQGLWKDSQGDMEKFKLLLEAWFDRTMEHTIEWYKRKIRLITFVLGFLLAWFFYADTFVIVKTLSVDKDARDKMVSMANAYVENNKIAVDTLKITNAAELNEFTQKLDSLLIIKKRLQGDITRANSILGIGGFPPNLVKVRTEKTSNTERVKKYTPPIDRKSLSCVDKKISNGTIDFSIWKKIAYFFRLFYNHFFGFLVTAIAISLGAPFWFDLLNKIMKLKTSQTEETPKKKELTSSDSVSPLNRVG